MSAVVALVAAFDLVAVAPVLLLLLLRCSCCCCSSVTVVAVALVAAVVTVYGSYGCTIALVAVVAFIFRLLQRVINKFKRNVCENRVNLQKNAAAQPPGFRVRGAASG